MAEILEFRPAESKRHDSDLSAGERGPAEVVVFPGVRYEHWAESQAKGKASETIQHHRDVIELAE